MKFAADQKAVLQSLREAAAFRIEAEGKDDADCYQATRTGAIYFKDGNKFYVAFDDTPDSKENIILARAVEGYEANKEGNELVLSKKDKYIAQMLKRAEKSDRVVEVVESPLELATKASNGVSDFGSNKAVQALFGDIAEPYAAMLKSRKYDKGFVYVLSPKSLDKTVDSSNAVVRPVGLGGVDCDDIDNVIAVNQFIYSSRVRGVRPAQKNSTGNKALVESNTRTQNTKKRFWTMGTVTERNTRRASRRNQRILRTSRTSQQTRRPQKTKRRRKNIP